MKTRGLHGTSARRGRAPREVEFEAAKDKLATLAQPRKDVKLLLHGLFYQVRPMIRQSSAARRRDRQTDRDRQTETDRQTERDRQTDRDRQTETERQRHRKRGTETR